MTTPHLNAQRPKAIVFDVNETLSNLAPLADRFADVGVDRSLAEPVLDLWFASVLRDGFALAATGHIASFVEIARDCARAVLTTVGSTDGGSVLDRPLDEAVAHVIEGFMQLPVHPDVPGGVRALRAAGYRLVTLTNGSVQVAEGLFQRAGLRGEFDLLLEVADAGAWKPARRAYEYAARRCDAELSELLLVAVHPWDIDGASRAGLATAWIHRSGDPYPGYFQPPTYQLADLGELAALLPAD